MATPLQGSPDFDEVELIKTGIQEINLDVFTATAAVIEHNLGYVPIVLAQVSAPNAPDNFFLMPYTVYSSGSMIARTNIGVDESEISLTLEILSGDGLLGTWYFKYYLLRLTSSS